MRTTSAKPLPKNAPEPSFRTIPRARSNILSTLTSTLNDISSNAASASSSSSDAWQHATRRRRRIISPSSSSPQPCYGSAKCPQDLKRQHDLADMLARFHERMGGGGFAQWKRPVDDGLDLSGGDQRPDVLLDRTRDRRLVRHRARPQRRAGMGQALEHDAAEIDGRLRAALERDLHDAAVDRGSLVVALDVVAADHVDDELGAPTAGRLLGDADEVLGPVVHGDVGAEPAACLAFLRRSGRGDDPGAERLGELDRRCADARGAAVNE